MESPDSDIYQKVKPRVITNDGTLDLSSCILAQEEFKILVLFLSCCQVRQWACLNLSCCHISDDKFALFFQQLQTVVTNYPNIKVLNITNNLISKISLYNLFKVAIIFNTTKIKLSCNEIRSKEICETVISLTQMSVE